MDLSPRIPTLGELTYDLVSLIERKPVPGHRGMTQCPVDWDDLPYEERERWEEKSHALAAAIRHWTITS